MTNVFFTSDLHFGHRKAAEHRGFTDVAEHDRTLLDNWDAAVQPDDIVWVLGDLAASSPTYALELLSTLPGEKHLISGNHDKTHPMHRDAHKHLRTYLEVFASVASAARRRIDGREVLLSHFPYRRDRGEMRHAQWRLRDEGLYLIHGHTHGSERLSRFDHEVHVGVDAWGLSPVRMEEVGALIERSEQAKAGVAKVLAASQPVPGLPDAALTDIPAAATPIGMRLSLPNGLPADDVAHAVNADIRAAFLGEQ